MALVLCLLACGCAAGGQAGSSGFADSLVSRSSYYGWIKAQLYEQYRSWDTVRYRHGGLSKRGVDCSGLVSLTFAGRFRVRLPRTTDGQLRSGRRVPLSDLRPGDLLFFDTGWRSLHVGIYIERGRFLHAAKSSGVTISRLQDAYWSSRHFRSVRILGTDESLAREMP